MATLSRATANGRCFRPEVGARFAGTRFGLAGPRDQRWWDPMAGKRSIGLLVSALCATWALPTAVLGATAHADEASVDPAADSDALSRNASLPPSNGLNKDRHHDC